MSTWTNNLRFGLFGRTTTAAVQEPEIDPRDIPVTLTQGDLDGLHATINALRHDVMRMRHVEGRSVRRLFLLAQNIAKIVKATNVTPGTPIGNDGVRFSLSNDDGPWMELDVYPFCERFVLRDASGVISDMTFRLDSELGDLPRDTVLMLVGYADFARRSAANDSDVYWSQTVNAELAPDRMVDA